MTNQYEITTQSVWRFWNIELERFEYGLTASPRRYENPNFVAMRRIRRANDSGPELFEGDVVEVAGLAARFRIEHDGSMRGDSGQLRRLRQSDRVHVVGQDALARLTSQTAKAA